MENEKQTAFIWTVYSYQPWTNHSILRSHLNEEAHRAMYALENYLMHDTAPNSETVEFDCAVIVFPTDKQLQYHKDIQKEDFDESIQSNKEYYDMIREVIEGVGVRTISTRGEYLSMVGTTMTWNLSLRKDCLPPWNLIFFTRDHGPKIVSPAEFGTELITTYSGVVQKPAANKMHNQWRGSA